MAGRQSRQSKRSTLAQPFKRALSPACHSSLTAI